MAASDIKFPGTEGTAGIGSSFLQPSQGKGLYAGNYIDFTNSNHNQWAQQFLPDVYEKEVEIYGNRTISSFLRMVSAEMPSTSDQIIWLEQGRLHTRYSGCTSDHTGATIAAGAVIEFTHTTQPGPTNLTSTTEQSDRFNFRVGQTVMCQVQSLSGAAAVRGIGPVVKGIVTAVAANGSTASVRIYKAVTGLGAVVAATTWTLLVYGSEFGKGTGNFTEKLDPSYTTYSNSPIIMKEHYSINGSDTSQIGWIEVTSENGASGYLWYVKAEHENRLRWEDYIEMAMLEAVPFDGQTAAPGTGSANLVDYPELGDDDFNGNLYNSRLGSVGPDGQLGRGLKGTQGFFDALQERGNIYEGLAADLEPRTGRSGLDNLTSSFDNILKQLDKQGAIEENMLYVNRDLALAFDNFLATQNNYGGSEGVSWGVFNNSKDMAIDLGFSGFRRGSYDFYKTDWKYLNDWSTRGGFGDIEGVMIPAGTSTVYDQNLGKNIKRPFLHVRYRASETDNRKMKSWITGSVGGAYTTDVDELRMHYLTERCLITQGANNFFLMTNGGSADS